MPTSSNYLCGCGRFMRVKQNGVTVEELTEDGRPYKLWDADLLECPECGVEIIAGFARAPMAAAYQPDYAAQRERLAPIYPGRCREEAPAPAPRADGVAIAERIARAAHAWQKEESTGDPYIRHIERVVAMVEGDDAKAVAWLHDVLEDAPEWTPDALTSAGVSPAIVNAVVLLTRCPTVSASHDFDGRKDYAAYIDHIVRSENPLAGAVKLADLRDHLRPSCPESLRPRYERAIEVLTGGREGQR